MTKKIKFKKISEPPKKQRPKHFTIKENVFNISIDFFYGGTLKDVLIKLDKIFPDKNFLDQDNGTQNGKYLGWDNYSVVWIKKDSVDKVLPKIIHELVHVVARLHDHRGIPLRYENDEVTAYLMEALFKRFYKIIYDEV